MIGKFKTVVFDTADHRGLAQFYVDLFGGEQRYVDDEWATVFTPDGWRLGFQAAPDHIPPRWPDPAAPQHMHLDIQVPDIDVAAARAAQLGATKIGGGERWHVMADPAGHPFCLSRNDQTEPIRMFAVNIDTDDAPTLAAFYSGLFGMSLKYESAEAMWIGTSEGPQGDILFQGVTEYHAPQWPDPSHPQQVHIDVLVDDIDVAEPQVLALGATRLNGQGDNWRVYADPSGHPFCLTW